MGNSHSQQSIPPNAPSSPTILVSTSIVPPKITFSHRQKPSAPKLVISLTNPTTHTITFHYKNQPLDVSYCFMRGCRKGNEEWTITDLTAIPINSLIRIFPTLPLGEVRPYQMTRSDINYNPVKHDYQDFITLLPGSNGTVKLKFDMNVCEGFIAGHTYAFKMRDFEMEAFWWGYGDKSEVVGKRNRKGEWQVGGYREYNVGKDGRGKLAFRNVNPDGAVVRTEWKDDEAKDGDGKRDHEASDGRKDAGDRGEKKSAWEWITETIGGRT